MGSSIETAYKRIKHVTQNKELLRAYYMREMGIWIGSHQITGIDIKTIQSL